MQMHNKCCFSVANIYQYGLLLISINTASAVFLKRRSKFLCENGKQLSSQNHKPMFARTKSRPMKIKQLYNNNYYIMIL